MLCVTYNSTIDYVTAFPSWNDLRDYALLPARGDRNLMQAAALISTPLISRWIALFTVSGFCSILFSEL